MSVEQIQEIFRIKKEYYKKHSNLVIKIIKKPFKELKEKADVWLEISKTHKKGRNIVG